MTEESKPKISREEAINELKQYSWYEALNETVTGKIGGSAGVNYLYPQNATSSVGITIHPAGLETHTVNEIQNLLVAAGLKKDYDFRIASITQPTAYDGRSISIEHLMIYARESSLKTIGIESKGLHQGAAQASVKLTVEHPVIHHGLVTSAGRSIE